MSEPNKSSNSSNASPPSGPRAGGQQTLRPLAPKPPSDSTQSRTTGSKTPASSQASSSSRRLAPTPCRVCYQVGCRLPTHTAYGSVSRSSSTSSTSMTAGVEAQRDPSFAASYAYNLAQRYQNQSATLSKADMIHDLPLESEWNTPEMHRLFHTWFMIVSQDSIRISRPAEIVGDVLFSPFLMPATQDSLLCLSVLTLCAAALPDQFDHSARNVTSLTLAGQAIQRMRERLSSDVAVISDSTIVAAVFLWLANIYLEDTTAMASHSSSVYAFVETRGGLHKLGFMGAVEQLIRWVDIIHSMVLSVPCRYMNSIDPRPLAKVPAARYGVYWNSGTGPNRIVVESEVQQACQETCRLFEVLEHAEANGISPAEYQYIWQRLCYLFTTESLLRVQDQAGGIVDKCVSSAISLIKFYCFCDVDKLGIVVTTNITRLVAAIKAAGGPSFWKSELDLFIWLLFVVVMNPIEVEEQSWCMSILCQAIEMRFNVQGRGSEQWKDDVRRCLQAFAWCDTRFESSFQSTCSIIQQQFTDGSQHSDSDDEMEDE